MGVLANVGNFLTNSGNMARWGGGADLAINAMGMSNSILGATNANEKDKAKMGIATGLTDTLGGVKGIAGSAESFEKGGFWNNTRGVSDVIGGLAGMTSGVAGTTGGIMKLAGNDSGSKTAEKVGNISNIVGGTAGTLSGGIQFFQNVGKAGKGGDAYSGGMSALGGLSGLGAGIAGLFGKKGELAAGILGGLSGLFGMAGSLKDLIFGDSSNQTPTTSSPNP